MLPEWADRTAEQIFGRGLVQTGIYLILGGVDTGKTTLAAALAKHAASSGRVGIIDADIGQSHIGPPATVGWAIVEAPRTIERVFGEGSDIVYDFWYCNCCFAAGRYRNKMACKYISAGH